MTFRSKVLIVDDHAIVRNALAMELKKNSRIEILATFDEGEDALSFAKEHSIDLLLIDYNLGMTNGIEIGQKFLEHHPKLKILLFSMYALEIVDDFRKTGFDGLIDKSKDFEDFSLAVEAVLDGRAYLIDRVCDRREVIDYNKEVPILSEREKQVLCLLAQGWKQYDIAKELHLSVRTIEGHRERICKKLNLTSIAQLALYAARSGIYRFGFHAPEKKTEH
jgi:DNA-binding NarL/FixJ family response regulator